MPYSDVSRVDTVAIVGCGTIGASWAAWFLARGYRVRGWDPSPSAAATVQRTVREAWPSFLALGIATGDAEEALERVTVSGELEAAVDGAGFVQESAPENADVKLPLLERLDKAVGECVIASSTSGFMPSRLQSVMANPGRLVVGHPFNPPHLIPLVEVVGGEQTDPAAVAWALDFYRHVGKRPIHVRKEVPGHVSNRLQVALWREAVHLVAEGVANVADVDAAIADGPGLRWAIMGPHLTFHLGGGEGGMRHFLDHLGGPIESWWDTLGNPSLTPEVRNKLVAGIEEEKAGCDDAALRRQRDERLVELLRLLHPR